MAQENDATVPSPEWFEALTICIGRNLPVVRVTKDSGDYVTIIWRNPPTDDQKAKATELIGAATHTW